MSVFGLLQYNENDGFFIDKPIAFISERVQDGLQMLSQNLNTNWTMNVLAAHKDLGCLLAGLAGSFFLSKIIYEDLHSQLMERKKKVLSELRNRPGWVTELPPSLNGQHVQMDSFECVTCARNFEEAKGRPVKMKEINCREIVFLNCLHCYQCHECFENEPDKLTCKVCKRKIHKVMRIFVSRGDV